ncbi:DUF542 domain-containing protein [Caulobacter sp. 1776]|uniref:DUF542 domain-containing protein n=1 Tax=Caulobacter sp. 1776 TaxID=3156420 RepID=UPI00339273C2
MDITQLPVSDLAVSRPGATAVFRRFKIDYCGDGRQVLAEAARTRGVDPRLVAEAILSLEPETQAAPDDTPALIDHLLERYHQTHRRQFAEAMRLARRVEAVHGDNPDRPIGLSQHLAFMLDDLEIHQQKEELMLFPMMRNRTGPSVGAPIACMVAEHEDVVEQLNGLARLTRDFTPPARACTTWRALYALCAEIDADLRDHMHLENNVLFRRFG